MSFQTSGSSLVVMAVTSIVGVIILLPCTIFFATELNAGAVYAFASLTALAFIGLCTALVLLK